MENSVDNVENLAKSSFFEGGFYFAYGKPFENACQELFENNSLSAFCTKVNKTPQPYTSEPPRPQIRGDFFAENQSHLVRFFKKIKLICGVFSCKRRLCDA